MAPTLTQSERTAPQRRRARCAPTPAVQTVRVLADPARAAKPNPYNRLLTAALDDLGGAVRTTEFSWPRAWAGGHDLMHFHWPEYRLRSRKAPWLSAARTEATLAGLAAARRRGGRVVWTVHNLTPHGLSDHEPWPAYARFVEQTDLLLYLSESSRRRFETLYPAAAERRCRVTPHGDYRGCYGPPRDRGESRRRFGIPADATVVSAVGGIEGYKRIPDLIREFRHLDAENTWLLIAGKPADAELAEEVKAAAHGLANATIELARVPDDQLAECLAASDVAVMPYAHGLNSGAAILALSYGVPVVGPAVGPFGELADQAGRQWVLPYEQEFDRQLLAESIQWARRHREAAVDLSHFAWSRVAELTHDAYRACVETHQD